MNIIKYSKFCAFQNPNCRQIKIIKVQRGLIGRTGLEATCFIQEGRKIVLFLVYLYLNPTHDLLECGLDYTQSV